MKATDIYNILLHIMGELKQKSGDRILNSRDNILLKGPPGVGKTSLIEQACAEVGVDLLVVHAVTQDPTDPKGMPAITTNPDTMEQEAAFLPFGDMKSIIEATKPLFVFLDDLGQAPQAVQAAYMQLLQSRKLNGFKVPDCVKFGAATNRREDRAGVGHVLTALVSRFPINLTMEVDLDSWANYSITDDEIDKTVVSYARWVHGSGKPVWHFDPKEEMENPCMPRTLSALGRLHKSFGDTIHPEIVNGCVGKANGTMFLAFLKTYKMLPDPDEILRNPEKGEVPDKDRPDVMYALCGALAQRVSTKVIDNLVTYAKRLPREYEVTLIRDVMKIDERRKLGVTQTSALAKWINSNSDLIFG